MIEQAILQLLRAHAPLMTLLGGRSVAVDLVDVHQDVNPPYLVFNMGDGQRMGRGNLCDPTSLGALSQQILLTPWAKTAPEVQAINAAASAALLGGRRLVAGVQIQSIQWTAYRAWAREPATQLLTRGLVLTVQHDE
jgi:hypothetical protein